MRIILSTLRITFILLIIGGTVVLAGLLGYKLALQPQVTVVAPAGSTIRVVNMQNGKVAQTTVSGTSATISTDVGDYQIAVSSSTGSQMFYIQTALLKRVSLQVALPRQFAPTQIMRQVAYNAVGDAGRLAYLNTSAQAIEQLAGGNKVALNGAAATDAQDMKIIAGNRAIVLANGELYVLQNGRMDAIRTDGFPSGIGSLVIGTNPAQESFAVLANNILFWYQSPSAEPQQIAKLDKQADQLAVGGDQVIAYSTHMPNAKQDIRYAYTPTYAVDPLLISLASGNQRTIGHGPIVDASISPDGQWATIEQRGATHTDLVRLSDDTTIQPVENPDTLSPVWISNTRYVYGKGSSVWMFDVDTLSATTLTTLPSDQPVTSVTYNPDTQQYLVTTYPNEQGAAIYQLQ